MQYPPPIFVSIPNGPSGYAQPNNTFAQVRPRQYLLVQVQTPSAALLLPQYQYPRPLWQTWQLPTPFVGTSSLLPVGQTNNY
jgi:hypothetical protein